MYVNVRRNKMYRMSKIEINNPKTYYVSRHAFSLQSDWYFKYDEWHFVMPELAENSVLSGILTHFKKRD